MSANIRHSSISNEHYTPKDIVRLSRKTLGYIDLDPASSYKANQTIQAFQYYDKESNGFTKNWFGRIFLNPPGGWCDLKGAEVIKASGNRPGCTATGACGLSPDHVHDGMQSSAAAWWKKLMTAWLAGNISSAIFLGFSIEILQTTQTSGVRSPLTFPICYPKQRIKFVREDGEVGASPPHASCIICVSAHQEAIERFEENFSTLGHVVIPA